LDFAAGKGEGGPKFKSPNVRVEQKLNGELVRLLMLLEK